MGNRGCVLLRKPRSWEQRAGMTPCSSAASAQHVCYAKKVALCLQTIKKPNRLVQTKHTEQAGCCSGRLAVLGILGCPSGVGAAVPPCGPYCCPTPSLARTPKGCPKALPRWGLHPTAVRGLPGCCTQCQSTGRADTI